MSFSQQEYVDLEVVGEEIMHRAEAENGQHMRFMALKSMSEALSPRQIRKWRIQLTAAGRCLCRDLGLGEL